jgi:voltage-gated potassium channel
MRTGHRDRTVQATHRRCAVVGEPDGGIRRGRAVVVTLLRSAATSAVLLVAYYRAPLNRPLDWATGWLFLLALLVFAAVTAAELLGILRSEQPRLRAVRALALALPLLLVVFASTYCILSDQEVGAFTEPLGRTDGLYFTVTVFATVGFGDIAPVTEMARVLVTIQMLVGLLAVGLIAKLALGAVHVAVARRAGTPDRTADEPAPRV